MSDVDAETSVREIGDGQYTTRLDAAWNIGAHPNGGYAMLAALRASLDIAVHPDPLSLTVHFVRPATANRDADVTARIVRAGRTTTNVTATMTQDGTTRLVVHAVLGDLAAASPGATSGADLARAPPKRPSPDQCVDRRELDQGVDLPILSRLDVRVRPEHVVADRSGAAVVEGWVRFADGTPPQTQWLPLFADAFPPALQTRMGAVGWVPTIELTVRVRRRPVAGWVLARFECDDIHNGRMTESGTLWDSAGAVVARSRQLGLVLTR